MEDAIKLVDTMGLGWLISPMSFAAFRDQYWGQASLRIARRDPSYYASVFSEADLEETLFAASRVRKAVEELTEDENPRPTRGHAGALAVLRAGKSLRITGIQRFSLKLAKLSHDLEQIFSTPVNINLYLSPSQKKALSRHFDTHDVLVMQLFGRKLWRLFGPPMPCPLEHLPVLQGESLREMKHYRLESEAKTKNKLSSKLSEEFVLSPGDFLYLPRGFWHEAETEPGSVSCHLTVGLLPMTYLDLLSVALAQAAKTDPELRKQLPLGFATHTDGGEEVARSLADILEHLHGKIDAKAALSQIGNVFHRHYRDLLENKLLEPLQVSEVDKIGVDSWVHVRKGLVIGVDQTVTPAEFIFGPNGFQIDSSFVEACRFMCRQQSFTPAMLPGDLTNEQKVILVKQLITENVLLSSEKEVRQVTFDHSRQSLSGWVPCGLRIKNQRVNWVLLDETGMRDPFLFQTVRRRREENPAYIRKTGLEALLRMKEDLPPCGFIFHVSRCGSTMLANALRSIKGSVVVSEPQPVSQLLLASTEELATADLQESQDAALFRGLLQAYGQKRTTEERSLVIKFTSWNLLFMAKIRRLWPDVPCVILIRNPLEVAVSCIAQPPGWMRKQGILQGFSPAAPGIQDIDTPEAAYAHVLGVFFKVIAKQVDGLCHVVDYKDLNVTAITEIAQFFKMPVSIERDGEVLSSTLSTYSKDPLASSPFTADSERKRASASDLLRYEIERRAEPYYAEVRRAAVADTFLVNQGSM